MQSIYLSIGTILTIGIFLTGCDESGDSLLSASGRTEITDGTGGGTETTNKSGVPILTNVDYHNLVDEDKIGIPENTGDVIRKSVINIDLKMDLTQMIAADADIPDVSSFNTGFRPDNEKSFMIADPQLVVQDSADDTHPIVLYMVPYQTSSDRIVMAVFATINNIAYNSLSLNQSHSAFYLRGSFISSTQLDSSHVWGQSNMVPSNVNTTLPIAWVAGSASFERNMTSVDHAPTVTTYACYKAYSGTDCDSFDNDTNNSNINREKIMFQPIATVGYQNFDFFNFVFADSTLAGLDVRSDYTDQEKAEYRELARVETKAKLEEMADVTQSDIGWYGLPINKRENIIRYHTTELKFTFTDDNTIADGTTMKVSSIQLVHYNTEDGGPHTPVEILSAEQTLTLNTQSVTE
jgi:hypothetical protein